MTDGYTKMMRWVNDVLVGARGCFTREATFRWFVVIVIGLMVGQEHLGITSIVRELSLNPQHYEAMLHTFRSSAWNMTKMRNWWIGVLVRSGLLFLENGMPILIGDGVKQRKEGRKMPCAKKMFENSGNSGASGFMYGHMFGAIGVLVGGLGKLFCVALSLRIHDGDVLIKQWDNPDETGESHVVRIIREAGQTAVGLGESILLLDRYYLSVSALAAKEELESEAGKSLLSLVTRAKHSVTAYEEPVKKSGKGRPPKKGVKVKIKDLFKTCADEFITAKVTLYGKEETISYLCRDLLWGAGLYLKLRFVLVICGDTKTIFVSTNLTLDPEQIIRLYGYRFKIECCFRELKQVISGFAYRFWTHSMPKLSKFSKYRDLFQGVSLSTSDKARILAAFYAVERFAMVACIALGLLQLGSLRFEHEINASPMRWLRSRSNKIPSEATTAHFMRKSIFINSASNRVLPILHFIRQRRLLSSDTDMHPDLPLGA